MKSIMEHQRAIGFASPYHALLVYTWPLLATATVLVVVAIPDLLLPIIMLDLWLLGYHHVVATYTRTSMSLESLKRHWFLNFALPPLVLASVVALALTGGALLVTTIYLHWQLFHYVRQSEGISKSLARDPRERGLTQDPSFRLAFYLAPAAAFLTMSQRGQNDFLGMPVAVLVLPTWVLAVLWTTVALALVTTVARRGPAFLASARDSIYLHFLATHFLVFTLAYAIVRDILLSWLMANIWHNGQYLSFVWHANHKQHSASQDRQAASVSTTLVGVLSQRRNLALYFGATLTLTIAIYFWLPRLEPVIASALAVSPLVAMAIIYQTINFHHYIVDAVIWRRPRAHSPQVEA